MNPLISCHRPYGCFAAAALLCALSAWLPGCSKQEAPADARAAEVDRQVREKWGKGLEELPAVKLEIISPNNENIINEFSAAFSLHHAVQFGQRVELIQSQVGGGGSTIEKYLQNVYSRAPSCGIDVLWGGGDIMHTSLAKAGLLQPLTLQADVLENVPAQFGGLPMYEVAATGATTPAGPADKAAPDDGARRFNWVGSAISGFGFLYNSGVLARCGIAPPAQWDDLGDRRFADLLALADPGQSAAAAAAYRMIVVSESTWPAGWAKLLRILANAKRFADSAGGAANSPVLGESPVAACIDFYGVVRVAEAPDQLAYISPPGQTTFSADPISILKNPPHPELAQRFVDFVLSARGQALWALRAGEEDGPVRFVLGRQPIRRDVYEIYAGKLAPRIINPYQSGQAMLVTPAMQKVHFGVLRQLIGSAVLDNIDRLRAARRRLNQLQADPAAAEEYARRLDLFNRLPENVESLDKMNAVAARLKDPAAALTLTNGWRDFFSHQFQEVAR
ncbi:MAG: ABC transporter substrate-binding protein [Phycisphaerae bacterium]|jgi:ABC-type Fe3+ transport system substrate-binding protein